MFNFNFYTPTRVVFGKETEYRIGGKRRTQTDQRRKIKIFDNEKYDGGWPSYFSVERLCLS